MLELLQWKSGIQQELTLLPALRLLLSDMVAAQEAAAAGDAGRPSQEPAASADEDSIEG